MPQGLQVWDANGVLVIDTNTLVPRGVNIGQITDAGSASIVPIAQMPPGQIVGVPVVVTDPGTVPPEVDLNGSTLTWRKRNGQPIDAKLMVMLL